ncbi:Hypothetical predicted protein [Paramuricea clavata]|uniref:Uncharacterized protein n=1 Tax=Paramuricea clavata TaxID=317549 RepID=A0A7D9DWA9_PARCT|nr:Hypothetical predicted protein [Paramuricea clavata]
MAKASAEVDNISPDETPGPCTSLLQVSNISCCNISNNNHVENVLGLGESCNHEATKQGLSEVEITSFVPEAVAANPCSACCDTHRRDIDKLNIEIADLKKKAVIANPCSACCDTHGRDIDRLNAEISNLKKKIAFLEGEELANSSMNMQIIHLQRDNSSLIKTVEMLSKQLLNLSEASDASSPGDASSPRDASLPRDASSPGDASSPNDALSPSGGSSPNNYLPPDKNIAGANATQEVNVTVSKSSTRNKKKDVVVIAGDSLVKNMVGAYMNFNEGNRSYHEYLSGQNTNTTFQLKETNSLTVSVLLSKLSIFPNEWKCAKVVPIHKQGKL